ncbi:MAG: restriction endonuclease, partial [Candidatus Neomarinimicrobiota bacterium]
MTKTLTVKNLMEEAQVFAETESGHREQSLFGVTDGKAVGTYLEHKFQDALTKKYTYTKGSSAKGIDFPKLDVDIKVTSIRQPQSSCPFKSARQKIYGLGYSLLVFVYDKKDDRKTRTATLNIVHVVFVDASRTADYQTTSGILKILDNNGNLDDLVAYMSERFLPLDDIQARLLAEEILKKKPEVGYLTISNALQWRLQYGRVIEQAGKVDRI